MKTSLPLLAAQADVTLCKRSRKGRGKSAQKDGEEAEGLHIEWINARVTIDRACYTRQRRSISTSNGCSLEDWFRPFTQPQEQTWHSPFMAEISLSTSSAFGRRRGFLVCISIQFHDDHRLIVVFGGGRATCPRMPDTKSGSIRAHNGWPRGGYDADTCMWVDGNVLDCHHEQPTDDVRNQRGSERGIAGAAFHACK